MNIKFVDPKLYVSGGRPMINKDVVPNDSVGQYSFYSDANYTPKTADIEVVNGLLCYESSGNFGMTYPTLSDFRAKSYSEGPVVVQNLYFSNGFSSPVSSRTDSFALKIVGYINIETAGTYSFTLLSDDAAMLLVDDTQIVTENQSTTSGSIYLSVGMHSLEFYYQENGGSQYCYTYWTVPGGSSTNIPDTSFFYNNNTKSVYGFTSSGSVSFSSDGLSVSSGAYLYSEKSDLVMNEKANRSYSFFYKYGTTPDGNLISLNDGESTLFCLYIKNGILYVYDADGLYPVYTFSSGNTEFYDSAFEENGFAHIVYTYNAGLTKIRINNSLVYSYQVSPFSSESTGCTRIIIGGAENFYENSASMNGNMKVLRIFSKELSEQETSSLYQEINSGIGNGRNYEYPLGSIPETIENDTCYILRKYNDGTYTKFLFNSTQAIDSLFVFGCPDPLYSGFKYLPDEIKACPWVEEEGRAILKEDIYNKGFSSASLSSIKLYNVDVVRNKNSTNYMITSSISSDSSIVHIKDCRFSSEDNNLDDSNSLSYNDAGCKYLLCSGKVGKFVFQNNDVVFSNGYYDAFQIYNANYALIDSVNVYSSTSGSDQWNGFCFSFFSANSNGTYDDIKDRLGASFVKDLTFRNVTMNIRESSANSMNGLILCNQADKVLVENVSIVSDNPVATLTVSPRAKNGIIHMRGMFDYHIDNVSVDIPDCAYIPNHAIVELYPTEVGVASYSSSSAVHHLIENVSISLSSRTDSCNSSAERKYYSSDASLMYMYSAMSIIASTSPAFGVHLAKDVVIDAPMSRSLSLENVKAKNVSVNGMVSLYRASAEMDSIENIHGENAVNIWSQGDMKIKDFIVHNRNGNPSIVFNGTGVNRINITNSNVIPQTFLYGESGTSHNDATIYCKNLISTNAFYLKGHGNYVVPVQYRRNVGNIVSLILGGSYSQSIPFRIPPKPDLGIEKNLSAGLITFSAHFAGEPKLDVDSLIASGNLSLQIITKDRIYDSLFDGSWTDDSDIWNEELLSPFKWTVDFSLEQEEKVYVAVYYNMLSANGRCLYLDPMFDWSVEELSNSASSSNGGV